MDKKSDGRSNNGGKRKGAGRPAVLKEPVNKMIRLEAETVRAIEEKGFAISDYAREAIERRLKEGW